MPWVRLHALKDYVDMVQTILDAPDGVRCTINLTPTLLSQVESLCHSPEKDRIYRLCRQDPDRLTAAERDHLVSECFSVHHETMLEPHRRYRGLWKQRCADKEFSRQDLIDLTVWFHLAWSGVTLRKDPVVASLIRKTRGFTLAERDALMDQQHELMRQVIPIHHMAQQLGRIEISTSPFHHPILPLLCATESAAQAEPGCPLPTARFRYPKDAARHLDLAVDYHAGLFGAPAAGMWPSEGAVSEAAVELMAERGIKWIATDEAILSRTLGHSGAHFQPWSYDGVTIFFRDHALSDRIGFVYSRWEPEHAAEDFVQQLRAIGGGPEATVTVALDGENAWEHFPGGGYDFLAALYAHLAAAPDIDMVTPSMWLAENTAPTLPSLAPGTWVDGSFRTWIGDPIKNRAWELVAHARAELAHRPDSPETDRAMESMLCAEASDWFWWFGEGHSSSHDATFDLLFRRHLTAVYRALDLRVPDALHVPLDKRAHDPTRLEPTRLGRPEVTGQPLPYYKWSGAGEVSLQQGSIHQAEPIATHAYAIYDTERLTLRLDTRGAALGHLADGCTFELVVSSPCPAHVIIDSRETRGEALAVAVGQVIEVALPVTALGPTRLFWRVTQGADELERFPRSGELVIDIHGRKLDLENWAV